MSDDLHQTASGKRRDVISWDEFFMSVAIAAQRTNHRILSVGYNGTPSALNDDFFPWGTSDDPLQDKHNYVVHAEANAVLNYRGSLKDLEGSTVCHAVPVPRLCQDPGAGRCGRGCLPGQQVCRHR